ncbi:galactokinase [Parasediminibacterium sp. JCM 36343]|uniref:galactokinase n=1 Tax=Parasediminibacterium sp. JCM 36343 TaxID=3374279 RepID=UPI00397987E9
MYSPQQVLANYRQQFGEGARVFFSPGRVNLLGEHVDYNGGFVLPAAIDKGIWFAIAVNNTNTANFVASDIEESFSVNLHEVRKQTGWHNYVLGILYILQKKRYIIGGFNCLFGGNLPQGAGLSSSAALEAGLVFALNELFALGLSRQQMALIAQEAEHSFPGTKCGIMDMFASLHGKRGNCMMLDCISLEYEYLPLANDEYELVLINSKVSHQLTDGGYNNRYDEAMEGLSLFQTVNKKITSFRAVSTEVVEQFSYMLSDEGHKRCLYITQEIERTREAAQCLKANDMIGFGKLMYQTHKGLKGLYEVSCSELDFLVDQAKMNYDVIGSRMMGGGFGGCTINLITKNKRDAAVTDIVSSYESVYGIQPEVYVVETGDGTREVMNDEL